MATLRQILNSFVLKRNWNPQNRNYVRNFDKSIDFTQSLGLECPSFTTVPEFSFSENDKQDLINAILHEVYIDSKMQVEDVALKCFWMSNLLQKFLKRRMDLDSIVTSGYLYANNLQLYYESKNSIKRRLKDDSYNHPVKFHT